MAEAGKADAVATIGTREWADKFHAHLDVCRQCEQHPFELCRVGAALLMGKPIPAAGER
jgi:hypothetical protein